MQELSDTHSVIVSAYIQQLVQKIIMYHQQTLILPYIEIFARFRQLLENI